MEEVGDLFFEGGFFYDLGKLGGEKKIFFLGGWVGVDP